LMAIVAVISRTKALMALSSQGIAGGRFAAAPAFPRLGNQAQALCATATPPSAAEAAGMFR